MAGIESVEPVIARLGAVLEFQFAIPFDVHFYGSEFVMHSFPVTVIGSLTYRRARIVIRDHVQVLSVFFEPFGFHALFGIPNSELTDIGTEGHSILGRGVSALHERLGNTAGFDERVTLLNEFFLRGAISYVGSQLAIIGQCTHLPIRLCSSTSHKRVSRYEPVREVGGAINAATDFTRPNNAAPFAQSGQGR